MLQRRKNLSHKQRREQMMLKRAVKRGDVPAPPPSKPDRRTRKPRNTKHSLHTAPLAASSRRLESSFVRLPKSFLKKTDVLASRLPLARPVPPHAAVFPEVARSPPRMDGEGGEEGSPDLTCPRRPKWRYDMSKNEVEANEQGLFRKWLEQTDAAVNAWCSVEDTAEQDQKAQSQPQPQEPEGPKEPEEMPHAPTSFERNLEVWRQVWRVTEISEILLILLDSRCPTLHLPPALTAYLSSVSNASRLRLILVLTKVDIAGPARAAAWTAYLHARHPGLRVVQVESYAEKTHPDANSAHRRVLEPHLASPFRRALVDALRETHAELLSPPESVRGDPGKMARWRPRVRREVDWEAVLNAQGSKVGAAVGPHGHARKPSKGAPEGGAEGEQAEQEDAQRTDDEIEPEMLTIGVIGQPNVGKSSLLNALFGAHKVKASRTPGKTKHFQTLFWTPEVRLVDCPGLVFPNYVPMETQVLSAILPISRVSAISLCIYHAAQLLPLEQILGLEHPALAEPSVEYKRTWREGMRPAHAAAAAAAAEGDAATQQQPRRAKEPVWTAMDIMTAYALKKGWVTARVGGPDVKRAGNASTSLSSLSLPHTDAHAKQCFFQLFDSCIRHHLTHPALPVQSSARSPRAGSAGPSGRRGRRPRRWSRTSPWTARVSGSVRRTRARTCTTTSTTPAR
ncbi:P-loop containing nucleoside triphosphate hydrolase protein [Trametes coccinea BRFM310]|uniref:Guanine nucleotide-binding protein-like 1 n=1 Tax=Trametes coccinea (strain BRFM310) TaxID=1353009 RepID=A0A1Y2ITL6_TRAC3|nr:P-loop containing nucleoside triphosphate hydrolase protein [Trametes coccinea BRFM310]